MSSALWTAAIGGGAGLAAGIVSSLLAPWAKWAVDKRQLTMMRRYELLDKWRAGVADSIRSEINPVGTDWFEQLRPYMTHEARNALEHERTFVVDGGRGRGRASILTTEIDRIEQEWKLR